jgi:drug/metabolite transporter (DMT)-like permease
VLTVVLGLCGALAYGVADFLGGVASRRARAIVVTAVTGAIGIVPLVAAIPLLHARFSSAAVLWGVLAGVAGSVGVVLLYTALAIGPMSVLSPVTSVFSAILPVGVAFVTGSRPTAITIGAIIAAGIAVVLVAVTRNTSGARLSLRGLLVAVASGCGFGALVLAYNATSAADGIAPLVVARVVAAILMSCAALVVVLRASARTRARLPLFPASWRFWAALVCCGIFDASANVFIQAGLHSGPTAATLPIIGVLNALYPIGTVLLAAIVLRERLAPVQIAGLALGLVASAVLALS